MGMAMEIAESACIVKIYNKNADNKYGTHKSPSRHFSLAMCTYTSYTVFFCFLFSLYFRYT